MKKILVVLSGGQDSTTCLYWAIDRFDRQNVETITFDYGQRHRIELECAQHIAQLASVPNSILPIDTFSVLGGSALTDSNITVNGGVNPKNNLPNTFVPGRNLIFLTFATAFAYPRGIHDIVTGVAQTDYSGYPDCRDSTMKALEMVLRLGMDTDVTIHTPLMHKSKKQTVELALTVNALSAMAYTHTCYNGKQPPCGDCQACILRTQGFKEANISDPLVERFSNELR